jgi:hypothetical protein
MLIVKIEKIWVAELVSNIWTVQYATFSLTRRRLDPFTSYRNNQNCSTVIDFFTRIPTKNVYLVIIYRKTWYFSELKTIDVHCRDAN